MEIIQVIGGILAIVASIWGLISNRRAIGKLLKGLCKHIDKFISNIDFPRHGLARRMNSEEFLAWQDRMLLKIYGEEKFTDILGTKYPVCCIGFDKENYGFDEVDSLCWDERGNPLLKTEGEDVELPDIYDTEIMTKSVAQASPAREAELSLKKELMGSGWWWKGYKWFTARSMRDGNHIGFVLDHVDFDNNKIKKIHLAVGSYKLNLLTSHILTYEFYKAYEKLQKEGKDVDNVELDTLWPMIPFRHYIHHVNGNDINKVLFTGGGRYALLSVQCLVMLCTGITNKGPEYRTFMLKRSDNTREVSTKLGCYQFPPSGGFDLYDKEAFNDMVTVRQNCSLILALMREYFEEIFNDNRYAKVDENNKDLAVPTVELVKNDDRTQDITKMLEEELDEQARAKGGFKPDTKKAYFTSVGANVDLIDLRLSANFLLVVNDVEYYKKYYRFFTPNDEFGKRKERMLRPWDDVEGKLRGERKIVEDSVALYVQGKKAFEKYINAVKS